MSEEMLNLYKQLSTNEKRNELSNLIIKLNQLVNQLMDKEKELTTFREVKNYDSNAQKNQTEDDILSFFYDDLWIIKSKILAMITTKYGGMDNGRDN
jgi:hypothetical protein